MAKASIWLLPFLFFWPLITLTAQYQITSFSTEVLPDVERIQYLTETADGNYWITSAGGITRFDGSRAELLQIRDNEREFQLNQYIQSPVFEASDGRLWLTSFAALHVYDRATDRFQSIQLEQTGEVITEDYRLIRTDRDGEVGVLKAGDFLWEYVFSTGEYHSISAAIRSRFFALDTAQQVMLGNPWSSRLELFEQLPGSRTLTHEPIKVPEKIISIVADQEGSFWLGTEQGLAFLKKDGKNWNYVLKIPSGPVRSIVLAKDGALWFTSAKEGVFRFNPATGIITDSLTVEHGLTNDDPRQLSIDGAGRIWVSQYGKGIDIISPLPTYFKYPAATLSDEVMDIHTSENGSIWATTVNGQLLISIQGKKQSIRDFQPVALPQNIELIKGQFSAWKNQLWLLVKSHIALSENGSPFKWLNKEGEPLTDSYPLAKNKLATLAVAGIQELTFADDTILSRPLHPFPQTGKLDYTGLYGLTNSRFLVGYQAAEIWDCSHAGGEVSINSRVGVSGNVNVALLHEGRTYLATDDGLQELRGDSLLRLVPRPSEDEVLPVKAIIADRKGHLWLGTAKGLIRYNPTTGESITLGKTEGLKSTYFTASSPLQRPNGSLLFNTRAGLVSFHPDSLDVTSEPTLPYIAETWVNGIRLSKQEAGLQLTTLTRNYQQNSLAFRLSSVGFPLGGETIEYQLIDYDRAPLQAARDEIIRYRQLPPGDYQLQLTSRDHRGLSAGKRTIAVTIKPPLWQTGWFLALCGLLFLLIAISIYALLLRRERNRQAAIRKREAAIAAERDRIAGEVHDDLGGQLSSIMFLSEELLLTEVAPGMEHELSRINELSQRSLQNVRDIIFALDNRKATLMDLSEQIREAGREFFNDYNINFRFLEHVETREYPLNSRQKRNLTSIVKEAWHNIIKYAEATSVDVTVRSVEKYLFLDIQDNGKGFDPDKNHSGTGGYGLDNMKNKTAELGGKFSLNTALKKGTVIHLAIPLQSTPTP